MQQFQEGMTATGPGGAKIVFRGGAWQPLGGGQAAPVQQRAPGIIYGQPDTPDQFEVNRESRAARDQVMQEQRFQQQLDMERRKLDQQAATDARQAQTAQRAQAAAQRLPGDKEKALQAAVGTVSSLGRAVTGFNPDYLGLGAGIENTAQAYLGVGTPGQRDWWADFRATDNLVRNELFGASLTAGEKSAYASTTITPDMTPEQAKINLERRREIARSGLTRYRKYLLESGYGQGAVDALIGDALAEPTAKGSVSAPIAEGAQPNTIVGGTTPTGVDGIKFGQAPDDLDRKDLAFTQAINERFAKGESGDAIRQWAATQGYALGEDFDKALEARSKGVAVSASLPVRNTKLAELRGDGGFRESTNAGLRGAADTLTLGGFDEIAAAGQTIFEGGTMQENLRSQRAVDDYDEQYNPISRFTGQLAGGFALPVPASANTPLRLAGVGAGYGAGYGFGSADGGLADRLAGAAVGGAVGGGIGYAGGSLAQRLANRPPPNTPRGVNQQVVDAAERQGVELVRPDVAPGSRNTYGFLESLPMSGGRVRNDLQRGVDQIEQRVADVGQTASAVPRQTAGENLQAAGERYVDRSRSVVSRLYDRAATLSGNSQVTPTQALSTIDSHIAQLSETPSANATKLGILNQLRADLVDQSGNVRPLSIQAIRDLRTAMRDELGTKGLRYTDTERRITDAIDSASTDIASQLSGPALRAFQRADRAYRERVYLVDNVVERFIGNNRNAPRSGEQVMSAVERAAKPGAGDAAALDRLMSRLQPNERQEVAATIAAQLGRRADDAEFSPAVFFSQIKAYSPEARAAIFGRQGAADLADLQRIAEARGGTMARLNNSRSGQVGNWFNTIQSVLAGGGAGALVGGATGFGAAAGSGIGVAAAPVIAGGAYLTARSLGNRRVVSALAQAARARTPQAQTQSVRYLTTIANREPALAAEILPIRDALQSAIAQSPGRAAAQDEQQ